MFQIRMKDTVFAENGTVTFQCMVAGNPEPTVCWFHNEALMVEDPRHKMTYDHHKATLTIKSAQLVDVGVYKCVAENVNGQTNCVARLKQGGTVTSTKYHRGKLSFYCIQIFQPDLPDPT